MGRVEFDPKDPDIQGKLRALEFRARMFGSDVIKLQYPGQPLQVFVGTNHDYQYQATDPREISDREK